MQILSVRGGAPLRGSIPISGAKNSVLPILAACALCRGVCVLHNCPDISDVGDTLEILRCLGCRAEQRGGTAVVDAGTLDGWQVPQQYAGRLRSSVLFLGALLARAGRARIALPGGCPLGKRPIDLHVLALRQLGAQVAVGQHFAECRAERLHGGRICLPLASVGATENAILAAVGCEGETEIENAAREPEIGDLVRFLRSAGAQIGQDGGTIRIRGGTPLHGTTFTVMPDRIETATYLCAAAACGGAVELTRTDAGTLEPVIEVLLQSGCTVAQRRDTITLASPGALHAPGRIETAPYPGFPTDAQAIVMAALLRARGRTEFLETIFENRFRHIAELRKFGAAVTFSGRQARLEGVSALHGAHVRAEDLRGGAALVIAALAAKGTSQIAGVKHILRGYDTLAGKLQDLGADIKYVEIPDEMMYNTP